MVFILGKIQGENITRKRHDNHLQIFRRQAYERGARKACMAQEGATAIAGRGLGVSTADSLKRGCPSVQVTPHRTPAEQSRCGHVAGAGTKAFPGVLKVAFFFLVPIFPQPMPEAQEVEAPVFCPPSDGAAREAGLHFPLL